MGETKESVTFKVEGAKEYIDSCTMIDSSIKLLKAQMEKLNSEYKGKKTSVDFMTKAHSNLTKQYDENTKKIKETTEALTILKENSSENTKEITEFESSLDKSKNELSLLVKKLNETGKEAEKSYGIFSKVTGVLSSMGKGFIDAATSIGKYSIEAGKEIFKAGEQIATMASKSAAAAEKIDVLSQKSNISTTSLQEWGYIMNQNGGSMDNYSKGVDTLSTTLQGLGKDGDTASEAFSLMGINLDEIKGKSPEEAFSMTIEALQKMPEGAEKTATAMKLLGDQGKDLAPLLNSSAEATDALRQKAHDYGMVMTEDLVNSSASYTDSINTLNSTIDGVKNNISGQLLPGMTGITDAFAGIILGQDGAGDALLGGVQTLVDGFSTALPQLLEMIGGIATTIAEVAPGIIQALVTGITDNLPAIITSATSIMDTLIDSLIVVLPLLIDGALQIITQLAEGITQALPTLIPKIVELMMYIVKALVDNLPMLIEAALNLIVGLAQGLIAAIPILVAEIPKIIDGIIQALLGSIGMLIEVGIQLFTSLTNDLPKIISQIVIVIPTIIDNVIKGILASLPQIIQAGIQLFIALINDLPKIIETIVKAIPMIVKGIGEAITENIPQIIVAGVKFFLALIQNMPEIIAGIIKAVHQIIDCIVGEFQNLSQNIADIGKNIIEGIWQGICNAGDWLKDKIGSFFDDLIEDVKDTLKINSPSKVFAGIGASMAEGLGLGFSTEMRNVDRDIQNAIPTSFEQDINLEMSSGSSRRSTRAQNTPQIIVTQYISGNERDYRREQQETAKQFKLIARMI